MKKVIVITGASSGFGRLSANALAKHHSALARREAGRSRRSEVSKGLRGGWHEA
jgi:NADP-dependent 3-hydroxy acid dehydrogenase YdfG